MDTQRDCQWCKEGIEHDCSIDELAELKDYKEFMQDMEADRPKHLTVDGNADHFTEQVAWCDEALKNADAPVKTITFVNHSNGYYACTEPNNQAGEYVSIDAYNRLKCQLREARDQRNDRRIERDDARSALDKIDVVFRQLFDYPEEKAIDIAALLPQEVADLKTQIGWLKAPIDALLFCPQCGEQHVDEAKPDVCETCGIGFADCNCETFTEWLNPPHKSHRCHFCNHVWRPADAATNGVLVLKSSGERDGNPRPRYFLSAKAFEDSVKESNQKTITFAQALLDDFAYTSHEDGWQEFQSSRFGDVLDYVIDYLFGASILEKHPENNWYRIPNQMEGR